MERVSSIVKIAIFLLLCMTSGIGLAVPVSPSPGSISDPGKIISPEPVQGIFIQSNLQKALDLLNSGDMEKAISLARKAIQEDANSAPAHEVLGAALALHGEIDKALKALMKAVKLNPEQGSAYTKIGDIYLAQNKRQQAMEQFVKAIAIDESNRRAHQRLGFLFEEDNHAEQAIMHYEKGLVGVPLTYVGIKVNLARLYNDSGMFDRGQRLLSDVIDEHNADATAHIVLGTSYLGLQQVDTAIREFNIARSLEPDAARGYLSLGIAYRYKGELGESVEHLRKVIELRPNWSTGHFQLAETLVVMNRLDDALAHYRRAEGLSADSTLVRKRMADTHLAQQQYATAIAAYKSLADENPSNIVLLDALASACQVAGRIQEAEESVELMLQRFPDSPFAHYRSGLFYGYIKDYKRAIKAFETGLEIAPNDLELLKAASFAYNQDGNVDKAIALAKSIIDMRSNRADDVFYLASLLDDAGKIDQAIDSYNAVISSQDNHVPALNNLAVLLAEKGRYERAHELASRAYGLAPENSAVTDTLGWILFRQGKSQEALFLLNESTTKYDKDPVALYHLGAIQYDLGNIATAKGTLRKALSLSVDFKGSGEAKKLLSRIN